MESWNPSPTRLSFEEVEVFMNDLCRARLKDTRDMPIVIVGNKGDVPDELRQVPKTQAVKFAEDNGCPLIGTPPHYTTSVSEGAPTTSMSIHHRNERQVGAECT
jgi:hypothetical protein